MWVGCLMEQKNTASSRDWPWIGMAWWLWWLRNMCPVGRLDCVKLSFDQCSVLKAVGVISFSVWANKLDGRWGWCGGQHAPWHAIAESSLSQSHFLHSVFTSPGISTHLKPINNKKTTRLRAKCLHNEPAYLIKTETVSMWLTLAVSSSFIAWT